MPPVTSRENALSMRIKFAGSASIASRKHIGALLRSISQISATVSQIFAAATCCVA